MTNGCACPTCRFYLRRALRHELERARSFTLRRLLRDTLAELELDCWRCR